MSNKIQLFSIPSQHTPVINISTVVVLECQQLASRSCPYLSVADKHLYKYTVDSHGEMFAQQVLCSRPFVLRLIDISIDDCFLPFG